jgi:hypothetical protein
MRNVCLSMLGAAAVFGLTAVSMVSADVPPASNIPAYTADGGLQPQPLANYRTWIFLSSGVDMRYSKDGSAMSSSVFDNVFVNPEAYQAFLETGTWPEQTMLVLEVRQGTSKGSINQHGSYQNDSKLGLEVHVKDSKRFPSTGWAFFDVAENGPGRLLPMTEDCYSCHRDHAAVDTTFVQFYPTLLGIAEKKATLSATYRAEQAVPAKK